MPMKVRYTVVNGQVIAENRNGVRKTYVPDPSGSTIALLDDKQKITDTFSYSPFGELKSRTGSTPTPFQYIGTRGYYTDPNNRIYVRARTYQPNYARWMSVDPLWPGESAYGYARGNPVRWIDFSGMLPLIHQQSVSEILDCNKFGKECLEYILNYGGGGKVIDKGPWSGCFKKHKNWSQQLVDCACEGGANPLYLMALAFCETHFGTVGGSKERCHNPYGVHFSEKGSIKSLCKPDGSLPTFRESSCKAAELIHRDKGAKKGVFNSYECINKMYPIFKRLCERAGKK
jgi:RHS repeat-associated protein